MRVSILYAIPPNFTAGAYYSFYCLQNSLYKAHGFIAPAGGLLLSNVLRYEKLIIRRSGRRTCATHGLVVKR